MVFIMGFANASYWPQRSVILIDWSWELWEKYDSLLWSLQSHWPILSPLFLFFFTVIRAKVVGKKLLTDGPFGTMRYTVKQMKVGVINTRCRIRWQTPHSCQEFDKKVIFWLVWVRIMKETERRGQQDRLCSKWKTKLLHKTVNS